MPSDWLKPSDWLCGPEMATPGAWCFNSCQGPTPALLLATLGSMSHRASSDYHYRERESVNICLCECVCVFCGFSSSGIMNREPFIMYWCVCVSL